jgi:carboxyl-terminal processing protease
MIMYRRNIEIYLLAALLCALAVTGCLTAQEKSTPAITPTPPASVLTPGPSDGSIAYWTARLLEEIHYSQQPLDSEMSKKFFDGYLEALDPGRENFLQSDVDEFARYRTNLDLFTTGEHEQSNLTPAFDIFQRYLERFEQHAAYAKELLKRDNFKFTGDDRIAIDRRHAPYPKDLDAAKELWSKRVRYEYLTEKLSREISTTNEDVILPLTKSNLTEFTTELERHYSWLLHMTTNLDSADVLQIYLDALAHAYDPHSDYLNTEHAQQFSIEMSLGLFGIGATLSETNGYCIIGSLVPGGPAAKSKLLKAGDEIVAVAQTNKPPVDVVDMDLGKVVQLIRGPKGTQVRLTISPADDRAARPVVALTRGEIKLEDSEAKAQLIESPDGHGGTNKIGVIDLPEFYFPTDLSGGKDLLTPKYASVDVAKLVTKLEDEKVGGIILDLRNNPGGSLEEAIRVTGLFIKGGPVVLVRSWNGHVSVETNFDTSALYSGPLVVLVNRLSASAAEITAAALQDYGRALVVGDTSTHGKGTVQDIRSLQPFVWSPTNDPGEVKITIAKFYRVNGSSTQLKGVVPDIILPDVLSYSDEVGESSLDNPLPWDTIPSADYDRLNLVEPYLAALRRESEARVATNQDFTCIRQDIAQLKKLQADRTATLNEHDAIMERQTNYARAMERMAEIAVRPLPDEKIYDITVENAGLPGLPAPEPLTATNENALVIATNENGSVTIMTTNNEVAVGIPLKQAGTNAPAAGSHFADVVTKAEIVDPMVNMYMNTILNETENILEDYISALSSNRTLIAN